MTAVATVYRITNRQNGHAYVGVTRKTVSLRWTRHCYNALGRYLRTRLYAAIRKYGVESFDVEPIASCLSLVHVSEVERAVIQQQQPVYNQTNGGEFTVGRRVAPAVAARIRAANTGKVRTPEQRARTSAIKRAQFAANPALRSVAAARLRAARQQVHEPTRKRAAAAACAARVWTSKSRDKLSASCRGRRYGRAIIDRMRLSKVKPVYCSTLEMAFGCAEEAAIRLGLSVHGIYKVCGGRQASVHGLRFTYEVPAC